MHRAFVLCALAGLVLCGSTAGTPASPQQQSPRDVLEQFCELDAQGKQLTPGGWNKVARLFVAPGAPRRERIIVIKDFVVSLPDLNNSRAGLASIVEYIPIGQIDSSHANFSPLPWMKVRAGFDLILTPESPRAGPTSDEAKPRQGLRGG